MDQIPFGVSAEKNSLLSVGETLGSYKIVRHIGKGGMGEVYQAWEDELQRNVAIKILTPEALRDSELVERFKGEGRALARIKHPNVVGLYQFGEKDNCPYIVMEYVDGTPLGHMIRRHPLGVPEIIQISKEILSGLAVAHEAGVIHRDVKPENVIVDRELRVKLIDFGIAKVHFDQKSVTTSMDILIGTLNYIAPEIILGKMASRQSDLYSVGLSMLYMLQGSIPFDGRNNLETMEKIRTVEVKFAKSLDIILPDALKKVVLKLTAKNPAARYADAREAIKDLDAISLNNLPRELRTSPEPYLEIVNRKEAEEYCTLHGFDAADARMIINLAAGLVREEQTLATEQPKHRLEKEILEEAASKYRTLKSRMITRRMQRQTPRKSEMPGWLLTVIGTAAFFATAFVSHKYIFNKKPVAAVAIPAVPPATPFAPGTVVAGIDPTLAKPKVVEENDSKKLSYDLKVPPIGTRFDWRVQMISDVRGNAVSDETWIVADNTGGRLKWVVNNKDTAETSINPFLPAIETGGLIGREDLSRTITGDDMKIFPLAVGNSMEVTISGKGRGRRVLTYRYKCVVASFAKSKSKLGEFDVAEVNCAADGENVKFTAKYVFAIDIGANLFYERMGANGEGKGLTMRRELIGTSFRER